MTYYVSNKTLNTTHSTIYYEFCCWAILADRPFVNSNQSPSQQAEFNAHKDDAECDCAGLIFVNNFCPEYAKLDQRFVHFLSELYQKL